MGRKGTRVDGNEVERNIKVTPQSRTLWGNLEEHGATCPSAKGYVDYDHVISITQQRGQVDMS